MNLAKYFLLIASLVFLSSVAQASKLDQDGILRKDDGSIHYMNHYDALKACPEGTRLPTVHEQAKESEARGAKGILKNTDGSEVTRQQVESGAVQLPRDYYFVSALIDSSKAATADNVDEFYFNFRHYDRPEGDLGTEFFWSSSVYSYDIKDAHSLFSVFGIVVVGSRGDLSAVRCVVGQ